MTAIGHPVEGAVPLPAQRGTVGVGTAHGTFGELLQGALPGPGQHDGEGRFLVTLPVARWASARFEGGPPGAGVSVVPAHKTKAARLSAALLTELGHPADGTVTLRTSIPEGKGLASSSADLVATARAVLAAVRGTLSAARLGSMLAAIEPTDGVMHPGVVAFDHRRGQHLRTLGRLPALEVVAVDQGGRVDTVAFNRHPEPFGAAERSVYHDLLAELGRAVAAGDLAAVGRVSTCSASLNQPRMPHRSYDALREICRSVDGLGLVACHSGTMLGLLLDPRRPDYRLQLCRAVHLAGTLPGALHLYRTLRS